MIRDINAIKKICSTAFILKPGEIDKETRQKEVVIPRMIAMYFARKYTSLSLKEVGSQIGGKDHATCVNSVKTVEGLIETNRKFRLATNLVDNMVLGKIRAVALFKFYPDFFTASIPETKTISSELTQATFSEWGELNEDAREYEEDEEETDRHKIDLKKRESLIDSLEVHFENGTQGITADELIELHTKLSNINRKIECYEMRQSHTPEKYASEIELPRGGSFSYRSRW